MRLAANQVWTARSSDRTITLLGPSQQAGSWLVQDGTRTRTIREEDLRKAFRPPAPTP